MEGHSIKYGLFSLAVLVFAAGTTYAQQTDDEFRQKLRHSLINNDPEMKSGLKHQPLVRQQDGKDILKVSPTTKLPTRLDRIQLLEPILPEEKIHIHFTITNEKYDQASRSRNDYSTGKVIPVPDGRSIMQSTQYTRNDYGLGIYADKDSPAWLRKLRNATTPQYRNIDLDPVRAIQSRKQNKRQKKIDKIKRIYEQD